MGEFFRGWKRKLGVVTLLLACGFLAAWVRSQSSLDALFRLNQTNTHGVISVHGRVSWERIWPIRNPRPSRWLYRVNDQPGLEESWEGYELHWRVAGLGFDFSAFCNEEVVASGPRWIQEFESWTIPYWAIVLPLTLLSAHLLLGKSRETAQLQVHLCSQERGNRWES
ncbi:hypothetical protein [Schlesneria paludicola]|uniref:hypothetical protein n=1 Tax=Schlesneria paludicola TaxID=360056 RepID=UPI00029A3F68|nr:hypothetical protein [Schlesneria paludicola]